MVDNLYIAQNSTSAFDIDSTSDTQLGSAPLATFGSYDIMPYSLKEKRWQCDRSSILKI